MSDQSMGTIETLGAFCGFVAVVAFVLLFVSPPSAAALGTPSVYGLVMLGVALGGVVGGGYVYATSTEASSDARTDEQAMATPAVDAAPNRHQNGDGVATTTSPTSTSGPAGTTGSSTTSTASRSSQPATESTGDLGDLFDSSTADDLDDEFDWVDDELDD